MKFTSLTRYYINADIPETATLKRKYGDEPNQVNWQQIQNVRIEASETTLFSLASQDKDNIVGKYFKVPVEVTSVDAKSWWYWACKVCVKKTVPTGSIFNCSGAECRCIEGVKRFIINATVKDINPSVDREEAIGNFAFFGTQVRILTGYEEDIVVASVEGKTEELPPAIVAIIGRKYLVTGHVTQDIYGQEAIPFRVSATEVINSSPMAPQKTVGSNLVASSQETTPSPPNQSENVQALNATPSKEVIKNYESDVEGDSSSASGKKNKRAKTTASTTGKKSINKNLFTKK